MEELVPQKSAYWALAMLRIGYAVRRRGWKEKNQYIELATEISYKNGLGEVINCEHGVIAFVGPNGVQMGWIPSQEDWLALDWEDAD